jgi:transmembrane protein EpsG
MIIYLFNLFIVLLMLYFSRAITTQTDSSPSFNSKGNVNITGIKFISIFLAFSSMVLVSGLRYDVGTDYFGHEILFNSIVKNEGIIFHLQIEPVFIIISELISLFSDNPAWMFFFTSFFIVYFIFKASMNSIKMYDLAIFLFIALGFYTSSLNIVRQWMAASVLLYGYTFLAKNQDIKFFKYVALAFVCHYSAIILLPLYFFIKRVKKESTRIIVIVIGIILFSYTNFVIGILQTISLNVVFFNKYHKYLVLDENIGGNIFVLPMFSLLVYLLYLFVIKTKKNNIVGLDVYINILTLGFVFSLLGQKIMILNRLQFYFVSILIIVIPLIASTLRKDQRIFFYLACVFMGTAFYIYSLIQNGGEPLPYKSILSI